MTKQKTNLKNAGAVIALPANKTTNNLKSKDMKTIQISNEMKAIQYNKGGIESFTSYLTNICYGIGKNPFRTIFGYVKSAERAFELLALNPKQQEELKSVGKVKILLAQLESRVNLRLNKQKAKDILCAFHKYLEFITWMNTPEPVNATAAKVATLPKQVQEQDYISKAA